MNNNASGDKYSRPKIVKHHYEPIDLKALYEKVKKQKEQILNICPICGYNFTEKDFPNFTHDHKELQK